MHPVSFEPCTCLGCCLAQIVQRDHVERRGDLMMWAVAIVLGLLWALGVANSQTAGGYVHLFIGVAVVLVGYGIYRRRRERRAP